MNLNCKNSIIFVGGIHGVGKTTLCKKLAEELSIDHYSASDLISNLKCKSENKNKWVENIKGNQNILLESINQCTSGEKLFLLDGHFCLLDNCGEITEISEDTFRALGIRAIIVLVDDELEILNRLIKRDNNSYSITLLKEFQEREISYAQRVAKHIGVEVRIFNVTSSIKDMVLFLDDIIR